MKIRTKLLSVLIVFTVLFGNIAYAGGKANILNTSSPTTTADTRTDQSEEKAGMKIKLQLMAGADSHTN